MQDQSGISIQQDQYQEYRSAPQSQSGYIYLQVIFKPDAKEIDIRKLLTKLNASIVEGPGEFGGYVVRIEQASGVSVEDQLRGSGLIDMLEEVKGAQ